MKTRIGPRFRRPPLVGLVADRLSGYRQAPAGPAFWPAMRDGDLERTAIATPLSPAKPGITSQAMRAGGLVFTAGVMPLDPERLSLPPGGVGAETHQAMRNLRALLEASGSSFDRLVHVTVYLRDWADFDEMNRVYVSYLEPPYPTRACVDVSHIGDDAALEMVAIALAGGAAAGTD